MNAKEKPFNKANSRRLGAAGGNADSEAQLRTRKRAIWVALRAKAEKKIAELETPMLLQKKKAIDARLKELNAAS